MGTSSICLEEKSKPQKLSEYEKKHLTNINTKIADYVKEIDEKIKYYREKINDLNIPLEKEKNEILLKINESEDYVINDEISEFYKLLNEKVEKCEICNTFYNFKKDLENLKEQLNNPEINKEIIYNKFNEFDSFEKRYENIKAKDKKVKSNEHIPKDMNSINVNNINNFCKLKDKLITEFKEIKNNGFDTNFQNYENELNICKKQIKEAIISAINDNYNSKTPLSTDRIENQIQKGNIILDTKSLKTLSNQLILIKNIQCNKKQNLQNLMNFLNQREKEINSDNSFILRNIKNKNKNLKFIQKTSNNLNKSMNILNNEITKIEQVIQNLNSFEQNNIYNINYNYNIENNNIFDENMQKINYLQHEIENEINNKNNNNIYLLIIKTYSEIQNFNELNNDSQFLLQDYFNERKGKNNSTYNLLKEKEKEKIGGIFQNIKLNVINMITNDSKINSIPNIESKIIEKIAINKDSHNFFKNKIINEINLISKDENRFKIDYLNILVVGRKGIGKTTLIKYILELRNDDYIDYRNNDFIIYNSKQIKYLRIIEVKGIGYDSGSTPVKIQEKIENYINTANNNNQDYNSVIHCIWYCIYGERFENSEDTLFLELIKIYKGNKIPIILVYTKAVNLLSANEFHKEMKGDGIENEFVPVIAEDITLTNGAIKRAEGKEKLISCTLKECSKALKSDILNIMIQQISKYVENKLIELNETIKNEIIYKTKNDSTIENYEDVLQNGDFIKYIVDLFFKYLNDFYDKENDDNNKNKNLFYRSVFILSLKNIYCSYRENIKKMIKSAVKEKSKELIDIQVELEKQYGNMNINDKRNLKEFERDIQIFLKKNYYFIAQNYIINILFRSQSSNNFYNNYLVLIIEKFKEIIKTLTNVNNNEIRGFLENCYKEKLKLFSKNYSYLNLDIILENNSQKPYFYYQRNLDNENLENVYENSNSFIVFENKYNNYNKIRKTIISTKWFRLNDIKWKFLKNELKTGIKNFIEEIKYQESSFNFKNDDNTFNFLQNEIKNDLINFLNDNLSQYMNEILSNYNKQNYQNDFNDNILEQIITNENIESHYKTIIYESLSNYAKNHTSIKLEKISVVLTGKSGVGKSTLINCFLKTNAPEGTKKVITLETKVYKNELEYPFLILTDTRGHELNKEYNPEKIKEEILNTIQAEKETKFMDYIKNLWNFISNNKESENNNFNKHYHCIWYCVHSNELDSTEISALDKLINNTHKIPLIVVFTHALIEDDINKMRNQIKSIFPDLKFIKVLARDAAGVKKYGLDELFKLTLDSIKSKGDNDIIDSIKNEYRTKEEEMIKRVISDDKANIINKLVKEFINNYNSIKNEIDFERYILNLIEKLIIGFSDKNEVSKVTKALIQGNQITNCIKSYISFYYQLVQKYLDNILENKSLEYLDIQVKIEKDRKTSIMPENKRSRENFKNLISEFIKDNLFYVAQKYLIYRLIKDSFETLSEKLGQNISKKMVTFLSSYEADNGYKKIYLKVFDDFEKRLNKYRNGKGNIFD